MSAATAARPAALPPEPDGLERMTVQSTFGAPDGPLDVQLAFDVEGHPVVSFMIDGCKVQTLTTYGPAEQTVWVTGRLTSELRWKGPDGAEERPPDVPRVRLMLRHRKCVAVIDGREWAASAN